MSRLIIRNVVRRVVLIIIPSEVAASRTDEEEDACGKEDEGHGNQPIAWPEMHYRIQMSVAILFDAEVHNEGNEHEISEVLDHMLGSLERLYEGPVPDEFV